MPNQLTTNPLTRLETTPHYSEDAFILAQFFKTVPFFFFATRICVYPRRVKEKMYNIFFLLVKIVDNLTSFMCVLSSSPPLSHCVYSFLFSTIFTEREKKKMAVKEKKKGCRRRTKVRRRSNFRRFLYKYRARRVVVFYGKVGRGAQGGQGQGCE